MDTLMQSPNATELLTILFQRDELNFDECCKYLPWDMSENHLVAVLRTLLLLANPFNVKRIFECVFQKSRKLAKLLIILKTDRNERLINLQILLSSEDVIEDTGMVAFLIREGADINDHVNREGEFPLHLACKKCREKTAWLLLQLGADVNVTDESSNTPFSISPTVANDSLIRNETSKLMVRHFARLADAGKIINEKDMSVIRNDQNAQAYYEMCVEELNSMKTAEAVEGFLYHSIFSKTGYELALLMINDNFLKQLKQSLLQFGIFPVFRDDMIVKFGIARQVKNFVVCRERELAEVFKTLPTPIIQKITIYELDLNNFEREFYLKRVL